ncbi:MAG TPA: cytochrome c oxidase subunit II [Polyangia bacterium]
MNELLRRILFLPPQASTVAKEIDQLHYFVILTTMLGATALTLVGLAFVVRYRMRGDGEPPREDPTANPPRWAEAGVIAGLLALFCGCWVIGFLQYVKLQVPPEDALAIYVTGKQWMWKFAYPSGEHDLSILYVPAGKPVKLLLTSRDVIHSFYVPDFRIKQDAVPGRYTTAWFEAPQPGAHLVLCAEYCGVGHSTMRAQIVVLAPSDYARWLGGARRSAEVPLPRLVTGASGETTALPAGMPGARGEPPLGVEELPPSEPLALSTVGLQAAGELGCLRCHTVDGSPHIGPSWGGLYRSRVPLEGGGTVLADEAYLTESMMDPLVRLHAGYQGVMPTYQGLITPGQIAAILELIKTLRDVPARSGLEARGTTPPAVEQGLPPAGDFRAPGPRLPIRVGAPGAPAVVGPDGGASTTGSDGGAP